MSLVVQRLFQSTCLLTVFSATPLGAEPITLVFSVHVRQVFTFESRLVGPLPFDAEFDLRMSFDPAHPGDQFGGYGPVSFSPVPLPISPPDNDVLPLKRGSRTMHHHTEFGGITYVYATATQGLYGATADFNRDYGVQLQLETLFPMPSEPVMLTAQNFPAHLAIPNFETGFNFLFGQFACVGRLGDGCFDGENPFLREYVLYRGIATLSSVEAPVIPEPATLSLVAGGLAALVRLRRKRCIGSRETS